MRHLLFIFLTSIVVTPIVALQDQLIGVQDSQNSVQYQMLQTVDKVSKQAETIYRKAESRLSSGVRELFN
jgi:hypothetical protein